MNFNNISISIGQGTLVGQVVELLGGLFLLLTGGALLYTIVVWRFRALQVMGETIGVRRRGPYFHGVYRYASPAGELREATSIQGSASQAGLAAGRRVAIQVMPSKPDEARERRAPSVWALAMALLVSGAWLTSYAVTVWRRNPISGILIVLAAAYVAYRLWRQVKDFVTKMQPPAATEPWGSLPIESINSPELNQSHQSRQAAPAAAPRIVVRSNSRHAGSIFVIVGLVVFAIAYLRAHELLELRSGVRTRGTVTRVTLGNSGNRNNDQSEFASVQFTAQDGRLVTFDDRTGDNPSPYKAGDAVPVVYQPTKLATATIDRGAHNWEPVVALTLLGTTLIAVGLFSRRTAKA